MEGVRHFLEMGGDVDKSREANEICLEVSYGFVYMKLSSIYLFILSSS